MAYSTTEAFGAYAGAIPSDFVPRSEIEKYSRAGLAAIRQAGIEHFGVRVHGTTDYPARLRDADHPVGLPYFQGNWELVNARCVAVIGTREPTLEGKLRAAKLARLLVADGFTVVSGFARGIERLGALVQARHALKQKRELFILESCFQSPSLRWPGTFAKQGAIRVADYEEIRRHLAGAG